MPTQNVTAGLQGRIGYQISGVTNWLSQVRNASTGNVTNTYTSSTDQGVAFRASYTTGRSGNSGTCYRTFLFFDVSSVPGTITAATLQVYGVSANSSDAFIVESTAWGGSGGTTTLTGAMYNDLDLNQPYSQSSISSWSTSTSLSNQFVINTQGISDMNSNGYLNVALINYSYDYSASSPSLGTNVISGVRFQNSTYPIRLVITYTSGYGNDVIGVSSNTIDNVINISKTNIDNIINV